MFFNKNIKFKALAKSARGLTLIEVVVSVALLAIVVVSLFTFLSEVFAYDMAIYKRNTGGMSAAASLETHYTSSTAANGSSAVLTIIDNSTGSSYSVSGSVDSATDSGVTYFQIVPTSS